MQYVKYISYIFALLITLININKFICIEKNTKYLQLPFYSVYNRTQNDTFFDFFYKRKIFTEFTIGSNKQIIPLQPSFSSYTTFFIDKECAQEGTLPFDSEKSTTFKIFLDRTFSEERYTRGYQAYDDIEMGNLRIKNFSFILANTINFNRYIGSGLLGLRMRSFYDDQDEEANIILQLKKKNFILNYGFFLHFTNTSINNEKGFLFLGSYPHEIWPDKYKEKNFRSYNVLFDYYSNPYRWQIKFKQINYDNKKIGIDTVSFDFDLGLMYAPYSLEDLLKNDFFNNQTHHCFKGTSENFTSSYWYCEENVDISSMKNITFYLDEENYFVLKPEDLFIHKDNKLIFAFIFSVNEKNWVLGNSFFKKYDIVFDQDKKIIGYYINSNNSNINDDEDKTKDKTNNKITLVIIISGVAIFFCLLTIIFLLLKIIQKRKKRANELDDLYDYKSREKI